VLLDDDAALTASLMGRHNPAEGRIVVHPTAGTRGPLPLAHDLLQALGLPVHSIDDNRLAGLGPAWRAAVGWIIGDRVEHVVVLRAHRLEAAGCTRLIQVAR